MDDDEREEAEELKRAIAGWIDRELAKRAQALDDDASPEPDPEREEAEGRAVFGLVAAHAFALDGINLRAPAEIAAARADLEELTGESDPTGVWERATDRLAMLAGRLLRELANAHGVTVAEELRRRRWGE
ncbi:hypothetical protein [Microbacterium sp. T2.11-28]|uniref:hypothetical protein n=1 Tax=Microbacterium sp. T2.11-28 TaxID=3041169 RepID=UPI0024778D69|nr:hypothetical protein [Microbacterium sp. T2.11-28]CAI9386518.1 hypothetical protein MICABA_00439 [Microbacterium sp. T2.11-28]